ncbi:MAG: hypothetical protein V4592_08715 [Bacteroidota bacterium]
MTKEELEEQNQLIDMVTHMLMEVLCAEVEQEEQEELTARKIYRKCPGGLVIGCC